MSQRKTITATGKTILGDIGHGSVGRFAVQISGGATYSLTFVGHVVSDDLTATNDATIGYTTPSSSTLSTTAITSDGVYYPIADGMLVSINVASITGTITIDYVALDG